MAHILIVEDDESLALTLRDRLSSQNHTVDLAHCGADAFLKLGLTQFDVIILDWSLPDLEGIEICRRIRASGGTTPILMLTGQGKIDHKEMGLNAGADDYVVKPCDMREIAARVRALLRRPAEIVPDVMTIGILQLDAVHCRVTLKDKPVTLTPREFTLLEFFMRHPDQPFKADMIVARLWPTESEASPDVVRVHINSLRKKVSLTGNPPIIETIKGVGYKLSSSALTAGRI